MIEVRDLTKRYADLVAVDHISFDVAEGEVVGFLGPNAAGKTTTMRILTSFMPATSGSAKVAGYDVLEDSLKVRQNVGYLPENIPLYPEMRAREYLKFRAKLKGVPRKERKKRLDEVMERCGLKEVADKICGQLSRGFQQRLGLAECLVHTPKILILDEPTMGLDPNQIRSCRSLIRQMGRERTILLSTHILPEVEAVCERVIIIDQGRIVAMDSLENLMRGGEETVIRLVVKGPPERIEAVLRTIDGVKDLSREDLGETARFRLEAAWGIDLREEVFRRMARNNWPILELRREGRTLEDVFVEKTMREGRRA